MLKLEKQTASVVEKKNVKVTCTFKSVSMLIRCAPISMLLIADLSLSHWPCAYLTILFTL